MFGNLLGKILVALCEERDLFLFLGDVLALLMDLVLSLFYRTLELINLLIKTLFIFLISIRQLFDIFLMFFLFVLNCFFKGGHLF